MHVASPDINKHTTRLPRHVFPQIACWFPTDRDLRPGGYRTFIEHIGRRSPFSLLTTSVRHSLGFMSSEEGRRYFAEAAAFAKEFGVGIVLDLCVRHFRDLFYEQFPDEQQEIVKIECVDVGGDVHGGGAESVGGGATCRVESDPNLSDHYTTWGDPYRPLSGRLLRVFAFNEKDGLVDPLTVVDVTRACRVEAANEKEVVVYIPGVFDGVPVKKAAVLVAFAHFAPDVFSPHLLEFQREVLRLYAGLGLAGACKDEWVFMGYNWSSGRMERHLEFFYSRWYDEAYCRSTKGGDLARDLFLMSVPQGGRERERQRAINHYMRVAYERHAEVEADFYRACKEILGEDAFVGSHPTWWPYPLAKEYIHDALHWWAAPRDVAQTDECTPVSAATALAKKWNSPVWYNMFYDPSVLPYRRNVWRYGVLGGRINYHPLFPCPKEETHEATFALLDDEELMRAESRIRLLNFIAKAPVDCRVAVVFGHWATMNWAGPHYDDPGEALALRFWQAGYPADLIPTSEIANGSLTVEGGRVKYGPQSYDALVLYHPEFEDEATAGFLRRAALAGGTSLYVLGAWTRNFDAEPIAHTFPAPVRRASGVDECVEGVIRDLSQRGVTPQTPFENPLVWLGARKETAGKRLPPDVASYRMIDGTRVYIAAARECTGDPISGRFEIDGHAVSVEAEGVFGIRLREDGVVDALAAGGLRRLECDTMTIELDTPVDIALWRDPYGKFHGVVQWTGPDACKADREAAGIPGALLSLTSHWSVIYAGAPHAPRTQIEGGNAV